MYQKKYLKYKNKYLNLRAELQTNQIGGVIELDDSLKKFIKKSLELFKKAEARKDKIFLKIEVPYITSFILFVNNNNYSEDKFNEFKENKNWDLFIKIKNIFFQYGNDLADWVMKIYEDDSKVTIRNINEQLETLIINFNWLKENNKLENFSKDIKEYGFHELYITLKNLKLTSALNERNNIENKNFKLMINKFREYKVLFGPSGLKLYTIEYKNVIKNIIFFYDIHVEPKKECDIPCISDKSKCIWINDFFQNLYLNSTVCIDHFQETIRFLQIPKTDQKTQETAHDRIVKFTGEAEEQFIKDSRGLVKTMGTFYDCFGPYKEKCQKYKRTRFHNIEFRRFFDKKYDFNPYTFNDSIFKIPIEYWLKINNSEEIEGHTFFYKLDDNMRQYISNLNKYEDIISNILLGDMNGLSKSINMLFEPFFKIKKYEKFRTVYEPNVLENSIYMKLSKQLKPLDDNLKGKLKKFIKETYNAGIKGNNSIKSIISEIQELDKKISEEKIAPIDLNKKIYYLLMTMHLYFGSLILDMYTMPRLLKSIFVYKDSNTIILYAGAAHVSRYDELLTSINDKSILNYIFSKKPDDIKIDSIVEIPYGKETACIDLQSYNREWSIVMDKLDSLSNKNDLCAFKTILDLEYEQ
ncbi:hypothetical protein Indivirus_1_208 [Indivirus ILV1]|uniref:Uncharacterized protein n=1 Tax=Indivirus ILV1 TaxID=1977633 RepID=A0A1V0SCZ3_9VIRU|nr:hypothetical protein Indivirus_1_208 [Indivirus ILV1]